MGSAPWWLPWVVYGPMALVGAAWSYAAHGTVLSAPSPAWLSEEPISALILGGLCASVVFTATVLSTRLLVTRTAWAKELHVSLRAVLLGASFERIVLLAALSAVAEELLFRAALQPAIGLLPSALAFGALHISPRGTGIAWPLWAFVMGLVFGILYLASGHLLPPILAHALINYENMQFLNNYDPTPIDLRRLHTQGRNVRS